jgi:hypothetical protein
LKWTSNSCPSFEKQKIDFETLQDPFLVTVPTSTSTPTVTSTPLLTTTTKAATTKITTTVATVVTNVSSSNNNDLIAAKNLKLKEVDVKKNNVVTDKSGKDKDKNLGFFL